MNILYLSQYFPPEAGATQTRAYEMGRNLVKMGHTVTMIAEVPNHPSGIIPPEYRGKLWERAELEGMEVIRVWVKASPVKNFANRMAFYLTYMLNATLAGLFLARKRYDVLLVTSPPLFVGAAGLALHFLRQIPMVFEVRDLWPESAVALGELKNPKAIALATRLEEACYAQARRVVVVTEGIRSRLLKRGLPPEKIALIPNGANTQMFGYNPQARARLRAEWGFTPNTFVAMYAGIHGIAQGLETVLHAADKLRQHPQVQFVLVGDGPERAGLQHLAQQLNLPNLRFLGEQARQNMPALLSAADTALIPLRKLELFKGALPSKVFDAWACERPVLLSVDGEARAALESCAGGWYVPPEDADALSAAVLRLAALPEGERAAMGLRGRAFTEQNFSRAAQARALGELLMG
ncbi:MAG: glycosyltransferase family 4 protein [Anaerolineales bacterium]